MLRPNGDHDLVGGEGRQRIRDRLQRIGVANATLDVNCGSLQLLDKRGHHPLAKRLASTRSRNAIE